MDVRQGGTGAEQDLNSQLILSPTKKISNGIVTTSTGVAIAEEVFFSGFSLAFSAHNFEAWTLGALPLFLLLSSPVAFLKIAHGCFAIGEDPFSGGMEIASGVVHLAGFAAIPSVAASLGGWIPAFLLLPSMTLPWLGVAVSELIMLGSLLHKYKNSSIPTPQLKNEIMQTCIRVTALLFFAAGAAFSAPAIGFSVTAVGLFCGFSLGCRYYNYQFSLFKPTRTMHRASLATSLASTGSAASTDSLQTVNLSPHTGPNPHHERTPSTDSTEPPGTTSPAEKKSPTKLKNISADISTTTPPPSKRYL